MGDYLIHYGVPGMKWGVRKSSYSSSSSTNRSSKKNSFLKRISNKKISKTKRSKTPVKTAAKKKVKIKDLSDADLQKKINRLQMEKRYRDLKNDAISPGKKLVGDILMTSGKAVGVQVVNYAAANIINTALKDEVVRVNNKSSKNKKKAA